MLPPSFCPLGSHLLRQARQRVCHSERTKGSRAAAAAAALVHSCLSLFVTRTPCWNRPSLHTQVSHTVNSVVVSAATSNSSARFRVISNPTPLLVGLNSIQVSRQFPLC